MTHNFIYTYRNKLHQDLHELLSSEMEARTQRPDWVLAERTAMWKAVNRYRERLGKTTVTLEEVGRRERLAVGHSDYGTKYALYCTELVEDTP